MTRILIVEDEADIQELLDAYLRDAGYDTALAGDGSPGEPGSGSASIAVIVKRLSSLEQQISNVAEHAAYVTAPQLNL